MKDLNFAVRDLLTAATAPENSGPAKVVLDFLDTLVDDEDDISSPGAIKSIRTFPGAVIDLPQVSMTDLRLRQMRSDVWDLGAGTAYARRDRPSEYRADGRSDADIRMADVGRILAIGNTFSGYLSADGGDEPPERVMRYLQQAQARRPWTIYGMEKDCTGWNADEMMGHLCRIDPYVRAMKQAGRDLQGCGITWRACDPNTAH